MKKGVFILLACLVIPSIAFAAAKPLCEFFASYDPGYYSGNLRVHYDGRFYNRDYFPDPIQTPNGGIKFTLETGSWSTAALRDLVVSKIAYVTFSNETIGQTFTLEKPKKYSIRLPDGTLTYVADYMFWLGVKWSAIGSWNVKVVYKGKMYEANFVVDDAFINLSSSDPIEDVTVVDNGNDYRASWPKINGASSYMLRVVEELEGDLVYSKAAVDIDGRMCADVPKSYITTNISLGRIEVRTQNGLVLDCNTGNWLLGGTIGRTCTFFKFPVP
jgi:hypothetical protein